MASLVPVSSEQHKDVKINQIDFSIFKTDHMVPLSIVEAAHAAAEMPVVFVKNADTGQFVFVGLMGLEPKENLFVTEDGKWSGIYIPTSIGSYPFRLVKMEENSEQMSLAMLEDNNAISTTEGRDLFDADGNQTDYLKAIMDELARHYEMMQVTPEFIQEIVNADLLMEQAINMKIGDKNQSIDGLYVINEKKLSELSNEKFIEFREKNILQLIYAHLGSLSQVRVLARRKSEKLEG